MHVGGRRHGGRLSQAAAVLLVSGSLLGGLWAGAGAVENWPDILQNAVGAGGRWLAASLWNQRGAFFLQEASGRADGEWGEWQEPDPSYRNYQALRRFYEEHAYLAWYGGEESGIREKEEETPAGDGQTGGSQTGDAAFALSGQSGVLAGSQTLAGSIDRPITGSTYVLEQLMDYDFLMKNFYNVHTSTTAGRDMMDAQALLDVDLALDTEAGSPQILIYHTHSQETFADSEPGENVVAVGEELARLLTEKGYSVYHDTSVYDLRDGKLDRSKAYNYALEGVTSILQTYPSIQVVLDIHRDGVGENVHLVTEVDGRPTAQIMFFNGLSQTPEGAIEYLPNPYREENLAFSLQMQLGAVAYYPGYTRKIYLKGLRYNMHLRPRSSLIEVGAQTNTFEEAVNAMGPLAELLDMVLGGEE